MMRWFNTLNLSGWRLLTQCLESSQTMRLELIKQKQIIYENY